MTLLAAFQVLLYRYSGQEDVAVGAPIAGRVRPELGGLIGFFVNTLVLRGDLSGDPSFTAYLARVRSRALEAYAHQDLPFEKLVEELHPKRDLSRNPLFQVALAMQNTPQAELRLAGRRRGARDRPLQREREVRSAVLDHAKSPASCARASSTRPTCSMPARSSGWSGHWRVLLAGIVADPAQPISRLPLLTPEERREMLESWNATAVAYPRERCIHELFEQQVARAPEAMAVAFGERQLTYARAQCAGEPARASPARAGGGTATCLVGVCLERSPEFVVGLLAILKAGGGVCAARSELSGAADRVHRSRTRRRRLLLTQERMLERSAARAGRVLCIDRDAAAIARDAGDERRGRRQRRRASPTLSTRRAPPASPRA